jgi:hypothetical protein
MLLAHEYMHREYEIREADKKTRFLAGVTRIEFAALKSAI